VDRRVATEEGRPIGAAAPKRRPGGRTERNRVAVYAAVIEAMRSEGLGFTYQDVAERAGVSRRTLHRRWPDRNDLIAESLRADYESFQVALSGRLEDDLREFALRFRDFAMSPTAIMIDGLAAISPDRDFAQLSRAAFEQSAAPIMHALQQAADTSQITPGADMKTILSMLISPIVVACSIMRQPPTDADVHLLVDHVLRAATASPVAYR
jgi:AcrR family transcriptional regulator